MLWLLDQLLTWAKFYSHPWRIRWSPVFFCAHALWAEKFKIQSAVNKLSPDFFIEYLTQNVIFHIKSQVTKHVFGGLSNYYWRSLVLLVGHLCYKGFINQSLYQEILLLQKFDDISGKVLKPKNQPPTSENRNEAVFYLF